MQFFINEQILLPGRRLKAVAIAPQQAKRASFPADLGVQFSILRDGDTMPVEKIESLGFTIARPAGETLSAAREDEQMRSLGGFPPFTTAQLDTRETEPGNYAIAAHLGSQFVGQREFVVMDAKSEADFLQWLRDDKFVRQRDYEESAQVTQAWRAAWENLFRYLGNSPPTHVRWSVDDLKIDNAMLKMLSQDALEWAAFHISRFVFDDLFYGGNATVRAEQNNKLPAFVIKLRKYAGAIAKELPRELALLLKSTEGDGIRFDLDWQPRDNGGELRLVCAR